MTEERDKSPTEDQDADPQAPNEGSPGHHPAEEDSSKEDSDSEQSFPASDPPANY